MSDDQEPIVTLKVTGTISGTFAPGPVNHKIRVSHIHDGIGTPFVTLGLGNVTRPAPTGCICLLDPWTARADGCPEHGLQPLTTPRMNLTDTLRCAYKHGDLHKILPRMTADEVATAERGLSISGRPLTESMRAAVRAAWKDLRR